VAATATIETIETEGVVERSARLGARLREGLMELGETHSYVGEVRGMGLMQALELVEDRGTKEPSTAKVAALMEETRKEGLLLGKGSLYGNVLRIAPPMLISESDLDEGLRMLGRAMARI